jgi:hypothetical protein
MTRRIRRPDIEDGPENPASAGFSLWQSATRQRLGKNGI